MRNLKLQFCDKIETEIPGVKFLLTDSTGGEKQNAKLFLITEDKVFATNERFENVKQLANEPNIIGADYLAITDEICLATEDGRILSVEPQSGAINENSYCDVGLLQMAWSPEQQVIVFITKNNNVVVMNCTYDPIAEHALQEHCEKEQQFVNVGWGKKETQFHGSEGKNAAKQKQTFEKPQDVDDDLLSGFEISWRQDGSYFVVSFVSKEFGRMFKVFDKEGALQYTSEKMNGLQTAIAWRPSGTWIAMPHALPNKSTIALFEKNGLRHREIVLPFNFDNEKICNLKWSHESDILVVHTEISTVGENAKQILKKQQLYLYTIGNYHWYLKQTLNFEANERIVAFEFGMGSALERTLHVVLASGTYLRYRWYFDVAKYDHAGLVAVIDGNKLLLTNLSKAIVPPPMSATHIQINANINACAFLKRQQNDLYLCLYDAASNFHLYKADLAAKTTTTFELLAQFKPDENVAATCCLQKQHVANLNFFKLKLEESHVRTHRQRIPNNDDDHSAPLAQLLATQCANHKTKFLLIDLNVKSATYSITESLQLTGVVNTLSFCQKRAQIFAQTLENKTIWPINCSTAVKFIIQQSQRRRLPHAATQILAHASSAANGELDNVNILALCENQSLYFDEQLIADYVSSFCMVSSVAGWEDYIQYFAFTKHAELFLFRLSNRSIEAVRSIESGGKIVAICAESSRVVLQMPRGNLEEFHPRLLLLDRVGYMLDCHEYDGVIDLLVKQRINLNIICDHDVVAFLHNIDAFVGSVSNIQWLNLFLSELRNEDVSKTMYTSSYSTKPRTYPADFQIEHKIQYICDAMLASMQKKYEEEKAERLILPIITAKIKMGNLEAALELIWHLKKAETKDATAAASKPTESQSEAALKYLLYLVDVNDLYNVALGTYDFGLVLFVAQKSQKDPREFLPFLNELKELDVNYRQFKIDEHLKRYEKALKNISQCLDARFEEALDFVKRHRLYNEALKCYANQAKFYKLICLAYADYLRAEGKLDNASLMYERGGDAKQAIRCAKNCLDWQRVLALAHSEENEADKVAAVALSMVPALQEKRLHAEAFHLLNTYGSSFDDALAALLKGNLYLKAVYEARLEMAKNKKAEDILGLKIKPSLEAYVETFNGLLIEQEQTFVDYKQRLLDVRAKRESLKQAAAAGGNAAFGAEETFDECDLLSDTTSMRSSHYTSSSRGTGKTFRSSKNRRKHERKHFSLKPGNPFEDIALIDALYGLIQKIVEQQQHVHETCKALLALQLDEKAAQIQKRFKQILFLLQNALNDIWIAELAVGIQQTPSADVAGAPVDYTLFQNEQRYALLDPIKRFKPQIKLSDWEHAVLNSNF